MTQSQVRGIISKGELTLMTEEMKRALALAALEAGFTAEPGNYRDFVYRISDTSGSRLSLKTYETPIDALSAAAQALGLTPKWEVRPLQKETEAGSVTTKRPNAPQLRYLRAIEQECRIMKRGYSIGLPGGISEETANSCISAGWVSSERKVTADLQEDRQISEEVYRLTTKGWFELSRQRMSESK